MHYRRALIIIPIMLTVTERLAGVSWLEVLLHRRSRRFGLGMKMPTGPLAYTSGHQPRPLTEDEEAALAFAAAGITGHALADLCYARGQGGNIMNGLVGRTVGSGDGIQSVALFVINDVGTWLIKRPRDFAANELVELIRLARARAFPEVYRRSRVQVKSGRVAPPVTPLFNINCNQWSAYAPGTSYFLPVNDVTFLYLNGLLEIFNESTGAFVLDERANFRPAGLAAFARSRGGHLEDDPRSGRLATIESVERLVTEFATVEQGMMLQNLGLMTEALGLGGFTSFANHESAWFEALGFRMGQMPASQYLGMNRLAACATRLLKRDQLISFPLGLEVNGQTWLKAHCPPYFKSMAEAVRAVVMAKSNSFKLGGDSPWIDPLTMANQFPPISEVAVAATISYCEYVWNRYGRFPAYLAPFHTVTGFQACHVDVEFYEKFYHPEVLTQAQREDFVSALEK